MTLFKNPKFNFFFLFDKLKIILLKRQTFQIAMH